jgi:hypothetical protein
MKRLVKLLQMVRRGLGGHADARMSMNTYNIRYSACAGEFMLIGLSADTIHRGTTMFDRHPTQRPR